MQERLKSSDTEANTPPRTGTLELKLSEEGDNAGVSVTWNGEPIKPLADAPNRYALPLWPATNDQPAEAEPR